MDSCICKCDCPTSRHPDCDNLCEQCWRQWSQGSTAHGPKAENSYLATYGIANIWTGWLIGQAPHLVAETPLALNRPETAPSCPDCGQQMVRRPGAWKCYRHEPPVLILEKLQLPRSPTLSVVRLGTP